MGKKIIIAEKPSVAKTYAQVLGVSGRKDGYIENDEWIVTWCVGHLVTLSYPEVYDASLKQWSMDTLPFLPDQYKYEVIKDVAAQFRVIKILYNRPDIDAIYYAGDSGREGIYIQALIRQEAGHNPNAKELVVWIDSQTESEILRGIREAKPISAYQNLIDSGYMRAIEDYALGINISRAYALKYRSLLSRDTKVSVGRVVTCVLGMIVRREREILNFVPQKFYKVQSHIMSDGDDIVATWKADPEFMKRNESLMYSDQGFKRRQDAETLIANLTGNLKMEDISTKEEKKFAPLLYNLAELQATCSKVLHISPDETLEIAQSLYEKKVTTYPRTDARVLSSAIADEIDVNLSGLLRYQPTAAFVKNILESGRYQGVANSKYTDDTKVTDHYAIIPTGQQVSLSGNEAIVYDLIVRRFVSIFMDPAVYKKLSITEVTTDGKFRFYASGSTLVSPGFLECVGIPQSNSSLPNGVNSLVKGNDYPATYNIAEGETKPPARYTSGSIVLAMENAGNLIEDEELRAQIKGAGIGTSATRAATIKKLVTNNYIALNKKTQVLTPEPLGFAIFDIVESTIPELLIPEMTAKWEQALENIANGQVKANDFNVTLNQMITTYVNMLKNGTITPELQGKIAKDGVVAGSSDGSAPKPKALKASDVATYLFVPFDDKDEAKRLGARFDGQKKCWYVPAGTDLSAFSKWMPSSGAVKSVKKLYLNVPFDDKDKAKSLGARWDGEKKKWYIMSNVNTDPFKQWLN